MTEPKRQHPVAGLKALDLCGMAVGLAAAASLGYLQSGYESFQAFADEHLRLTHVAFLLALPFVWNAVFSMFGLYVRDSLFARKGRYTAVAKATLTGTMAILVVASLTGYRIVTPLFLVVFWVVCTSASLAARAWMRKRLFILSRDPADRRQVLIVGTNQRALELAWEMRLKPEMGFHLVGFVDDDWHIDISDKKSMYRLVAGFDTLRDYLRDNVIDEVILALPLKSMYERCSEIVAICEEQGIPVTVSTSLFEQNNPLKRPRQYRKNLTITVYGAWVDARELAVKRVMDVTLSLALLVALAPLLALIAAAIRRTTPGPIFFRQERVGQNKRRFTLYKFRTMVSGAEFMQQDLENLNEMNGSHFKIKDDPRVTALGKFLRRTSMDELPQLFNVLRGDMSLVGPRPLALRDAELIEKDWPRRRFSFKPGITCLWQVRGRNLIPFDQWMEMDMEYIDNWSLWLDVKILFLTIPAVLRCEGAY